MSVPLVTLLILASQVPAYSPDACLKLVRIPPGCIEVPCDYRVVHTGGRVDFWLGYIEPSSKAWRVLWAAGMVEHLLDPQDGREIVWSRQEELAGRTVTLGRVRDGKAELLVLDDGWVQYSASVSLPEPAELLRGIARAYRSRSSALPDCESPENEIEGGSL